MYITRVQLKNFTAYPELDIRLGRGLNVIVGLSNVGKSQFLKALRWVLVNDVSFRDVRRIEDEVPAQSTEATVSFSSGIEVTRRQSDRENTYVLKRSDGTQQVFEKVGRNVVPDEIKRATGISYYLNDAPVNFAKQRGAAFLVDETPRERTSTLSDLSPLMMTFEEAASEAQRESKRKAKEAALKAEEAETLKRRLEELGDLDAFERIIAAGEKAAIKISENEEALSVLGRYDKALQRFDGVKEALGAPLDEGLTLRDQLKHYTDEYDRLTRKLKALSTLLDARASLGATPDPSPGEEISRGMRETLNRLQKKAQALSTLKTLLDAEAARDALQSPETGGSLSEGLHTSLDALRAAESKQRVLKAYAVARKTLLETKAKVESEIEALEAERREVLEREGVCPLCRRPL